MTTKIKSISVSKFTVFEKNEIQFSSGLNVFIGKNGTGKTHLLKILFSFLKSKIYVLPPITNNISHLEGVHFRLMGAFKTNSLTSFFRNHNDNSEVKLKMEFTNQKVLETIFSLHLGVHRIDDEGFEKIELPDCLYIPPQEMLSWYEGFIPAWENRENSFDETYYLFAKSLSALPLKNGQAFSKILISLEKALNAKVIKEGSRFYLEYEWGKIEAHLVAEGLRKLSSIIYLLGNGSINEKTIIFWDEPEVHFNPSLIEALVELIRGLTNAGVQLFITTHDYLLSQRLSLIAEYESEEFPVKFFCLQNEKNKGVKISEGRTLADIDANPILDEFADYYDFERKSYSESLKRK